MTANFLSFHFKASSNERIFHLTNSSVENVILESYEESDDCLLLMLLLWYA